MKNDLVINSKKKHITKSMELQILFFRMLIYFRFYPHIFFSFSPFKIYEFEEMQRGIEFRRDDTILDIGCGPGLQALLVGTKCKTIIGIDVDETVLDIADRMSHYLRRRINSEFYLTRIEQANFRDAYFDKIFSFCVIEHIPNYKEVLREAHRILKKDGQMIFSVDALETIQDKNLLEKHKKQHSVEQYFKREELKLILEEIGFKNIEIYPVFKSKFAERLFIKAINKSFNHGLLGTILTTIPFRNEENKVADETKGIFLIIKCMK